MNKKARYFGLILILVSTLMLGACGGGGGGGSTGGSTSTYAEYVYVGNTGDNNVSQYSINSTDGTLSANTPAQVDVLEVQNWITVSPDGQYAYITKPGATDELSQYRIENDGTLTFVADNLSGNDPWGVAIDPLGRYAYVANSSDNTISQFTIAASSGLLTANGTAPIPTGTPVQPQIIVIHPSLNYLYVTYFASDVLVQFSIQSDGTLQYVGTTSSSTTAPISSPLSMTVAPSGNYLYIANNGTDNVSIFSINSTTGALTAIDKVASGDNTGSGPSSVVIDSTGQHLYVANNSEESISHFSVSGSVLTKVGTATPSIGAYAIAINPTDQYLYVTDETNDQVRQFTLDTNGILSANGSPVNAISLPWSITAFGITR